jgi:hypothetical protein
MSGEELGSVNDLFIDEQERKVRFLRYPPADSFWRDKVPPASGSDHPS